MRRSIHLAVPAAFVLAIIAAPASVGAQEYESQEKCRAEFSPTVIEVGQPAVELTANLSEDIGAVSGLEAPVESGVVVATLADVEAVEMAQPAEEGADPAIELATEGNQATIWINTVGASAGTYDVELTGVHGDACWGQITVEAVESAEASEELETTETTEGAGMEESGETGQSS